MKQAQNEVEDDPIAQMDMQLLYYLKLSRAELNAMDLDEWARAWCHLKHLREAEAKERPNF